KRRGRNRLVGGGHYRGRPEACQRPAAANAKKVSPPATSAAASHQARRQRPAQLSAPANASTQASVPMNTPTQVIGRSRAGACVIVPTAAGTATNQNASVIGFASVIASPVAYPAPAERG